MATVQEKAICITTLAGEAVSFEKTVLTRDAKARALDDVMGSGLSEDDRSELHKLMDFSVKKKGRFGGEVKSMDKRGQRHSVETEDVKEYKSLSDEDWKNINKAMEKILKLKEDLLSRKGPDGAPLFDEGDLADELFTPLMREGLMPETFIPDEHSATAKLLKETFAAYKKMLEDARKKKEEKAAKQESDASGAGDWKDKAKAKAGQLKDKVERYKDKTLGAVVSKIGLGETKEDRKRVIKIGMQGVKTAMKGKKALGAVMGFEGEIQQALQTPGQWSPGQEYLRGDTAPVEQIMMEQELAKESAQNPQRVVFFSNVNDALVSAFGQQAASEILDQIGQDLDDAINTVVLPVEKAMASDVATDIKTITADVLKVLTKGGKGVIKVASGIYELSELKTVITNSERKTQLQLAAIKALDEIDDKITSALGASSTIAASTLGGKFADEIDPDDLVSQALEEKPKAAKVIEAVAKGLEKVLGGAAPGPETAGAFRAAAKSLAEVYGSSVQTNTLAEGLRDEKPENAFLALVPAAAVAANKTLTDKAFLTALKSESAKTQLQAKGEKQNEGLGDELLKAKEEVANFERELVLVDEGGMEMAKQRSIANLITQLEQDRKILELIVQSANLLRGMGGAVTKLGVDSSNIVTEGAMSGIAEVGAKTLATEIGGQVTAALNAARLIVQLSVNAIKAAERWQLWYKFMKDVEKALKAKSALLPAIENFFNNKKEQIAYHTIEDAMLGIQLAGAIASTIPHEIALVVGKTLTAVGIAGQQANKLAKMTYDEVQLRRAWKNTREAMNNPKNRRAGLQAIHDNFTLSAQSVGWAAMQGDAIAEQILRSCGVTAQTLADSDTDAKAVVSYIETLLHEDRQVKDFEKINSKWAPAKLELTTASWFATKNRGQTKATPKLNTAETKDIDEGLKQVQAQKTIAEMHKDLVEVSPDELQAYLEQATALATAFQKYSPKTEDNSAHDEMLDCVKQFQKQAEDRVYELQQLKEERLGMWTPGKMKGK